MWYTLFLPCTPVCYIYRLCFYQNSFFKANCAEKLPNHTRLAFQQSYFSPQYTVRNNFRCGIGKGTQRKNSDTTSEIPIPHRKYQYHIGNTDTTSEIPIPHRKYRYHIGFFRCGIGIFPLRAFPIPHRKLFLTVY